MNTRADIRRTAAEYVIGTLDSAERAAWRVRMESEGDVAAVTQLWEERLAPLHELSAPARPPAHLFDEILAHLPALPEEPEPEPPVPEMANLPVPAEVDSPPPPAEPPVEAAEAVATQVESEQVSADAAPILEESTAKSQDDSEGRPEAVAEAAVEREREDESLSHAKDVTGDVESAREVLPEGELTPEETRAASSEDVAPPPAAEAVAVPSDEVPPAALTEDTLPAVANESKTATQPDGAPPPDSVAETEAPEPGAPATVEEDAVEPSTSPSPPVGGETAPDGEPALADAPHAYDIEEGVATPPEPDAAPPPVEDTPASTDHPAPGEDGTFPIRPASLIPPAPSIVPTLLITPGPAVASAPVVIPGTRMEEEPAVNPWRRASGLLMLVLLLGGGAVAYRELHRPQPVPPPEPEQKVAEPAPPPSPPPEPEVPTAPAVPVSTGPESFAVLGPQPVPAIAFAFDHKAGTVSVLKVAAPPRAGTHYHLWIATGQEAPRLLATFSETGTYDSELLRTLDAAQIADGMLLVTEEGDDTAPSAPSAPPAYSGMAVRR